MAELRTTLLYILLASSVVKAVKYDVECDQIEDDGFYCTADLKRVHDCVYVPDAHEFYLGRRNEFFCPKGTRCSCHIDFPCSTHKISEICKPFETLAPLVDSYSMSFRLHQFHRSLYPEGDPHYEESHEGEVIRDVTEGRYFKKINPHVEKSYSSWLGKIFTKNVSSSSQLVFKGGQGKFAKFEWSDDEEKCRNTKLDHLPSFEFSSLDKYDLISSTKVGDKIQQKWYLQTGRNSWAFDFYKKWLTVLYDPASHTVIPQKYYEELIEGEGTHDHLTTITWSPKTKDTDNFLQMKPSTKCD